MNKSVLALTLAVLCCPAWCADWALISETEDPEKITSKRSAFIRDLASNLDRATRIWKANNCPALERKPQAETPSPAPQPEVPDFANQQERAAYFASLLPALRNPTSR